jgi:putative restriction endonuclease
MYFPKISKSIENFQLLGKYEPAVIFRILKIYLTTKKSSSEISFEVFNSNYNSLDVIGIIRHFGLSPAHSNLFSEKSTKEISEIFESEIKNDSKISRINRYFREFINEETSLETKIVYSILENQNLGLDKTDKKILIDQFSKVRNNNLQSVFRKKLMEEFNSTCAFCEINHNDLLVASHIVPFSETLENLESSFDVNNGLILCVIHDKLFENSNSVTIDLEGSLIIKKNVIEILSKFKIQTKKKIDKKFLNSKRLEYLKKHKSKYKD